MSEQTNRPFQVSIFSFYKNSTGNYCSQQCSHHYLTAIHYSGLTQGSSRTNHTPSGKVVYQWALLRLLATIGNLSNYLTNICTLICAFKYWGRPKTTTNKNGRFRSQIAKVRWQPFVLNVVVDWDAHQVSWENSLGNFSEQNSNDDLFELRSAMKRGKK